LLFKCCCISQYPFYIMSFHYIYLNPKEIRNQKSEARNWFLQSASEWRFLFLILYHYTIWKISRNKVNNNVVSVIIYMSYFKRCLLFRFPTYFQVKLCLTYARAQGTLGLDLIHLSNLGTVTLVLSCLENILSFYFDFKNNSKKGV
jgi:hypothetical protein